MTSYKSLGKGGALKRIFKSTITKSGQRHLRESLPSGSPSNMSTGCAPYLNLKTSGREGSTSQFRLLESRCGVHRFGGVPLIVTGGFRPHPTSNSGSY